MGRLKKKIKCCLQTATNLLVCLGKASVASSSRRNDVEWLNGYRSRDFRQVFPAEKRMTGNDLMDFSPSLILDPDFEVNGDVDAEDTKLLDEGYKALGLSFDTEYSYDSLSSSRRRNTQSMTAATTAASFAPKVRHTGTTIAGCIAENGDFVVIAADSRATEETTVADKKCEKVHKLTENIWCCGAGTSADNDALMRQIHFSFLLDGMVKESIGNCKLPSDNPYHETRGVANVSAVCRRIRNILYEAKGNLGVNLVLGGFDFGSDQAILVAIHPHGSMDVVPFTALGSGGLAAMGVLEASHRSDINLEEAIYLVKAAIAAGISNDLGSGSQIDLCVIGRDYARYYQPYVAEEELPETDVDKANADMLHSRHRSGEEDQRSGVGGFGSLPFSIKSKRQVMKSDDEIERSRREWLEKTLGLS